MAKKTPGKLFSMKFEDGQTHCREWALNFALENALKIGVSGVIVGINIFCTMVLEAIVSFERRATLNDETLG